MIGHHVFAATTMIAALVLCASAASASVIHEPAPGASVQQGQSLYFDWEWTGGEYWTAGIIFTQAAAKDAPIWFGSGLQPGRVRVGGAYGYGDSHATVTFDPAAFAPGQWYWRLCNNTIDGEDDKCYYYDGTDPVPLTITPAPPPPPAITDTCADGIDNDGDGIVDYDDIDGSATDSGGICDRVARAPEPPRLSSQRAIKYAKLALAARFESFSNGRARRVGGMWRSSRTTIHFSAISWRLGRASFRGRATIWSGDPWRYSLAIRRCTRRRCARAVYVRGSAP